MNLIDRNKIMYTDISDGHVPDGVWISFRDRINEMPTVEAIPVEWIKKQIEEWESWGPEGLSDDEWEYGICLETLLENWEKENETN